MDVKGRLYETDFYAWSMTQADALRAAAREGSNQTLDWGNLAEEIEDLGKSLRIALESQISRIIQHLVKLDHSPAVDPRKGWRRTIRQARAEIARIMAKNPSLTRELRALIKDETRRAVELALRDLEEFDEISRLELPSLRDASYTEEQILGDWFPEDHQA
jgi:Domain of unknown function DUF29